MTGSRRSTPAPRTCRRRWTSAWARSRRRWPPSRSLPVSFDPAEVARAGAFVSIGTDGRLRVERGYVRPEDELPVEQEPEINGETAGTLPGALSGEDDGSVPAVAMRASMDGQAVQAGSEARRSRRKRTASSRCPTGC